MICCHSLPIYFMRASLNLIQSTGKLQSLNELCPRKHTFAEGTRLFPLRWVSCRLRCHHSSVAYQLFVLNSFSFFISMPIVRHWQTVTDRRNLSFWSFSAISCRMWLKNYTMLCCTEAIREVIRMTHFDRQLNHFGLQWSDSKRLECSVPTGVFISCFVLALSVLCPQPHACAERRPGSSLPLTFL